MWLDLSLARTTGWSACFLALLLGGCASEPQNGAATAASVVMAEEVSPAMAALNYYQMLNRMTPAQLARERTALAGASSPAGQLRLAMLLGHPKAPTDLPKAVALLEGLLKSPEPAAISLQPLARLLADNYGERLRLDGQLEKQGQMLKESQRKSAELQEKIDGLADIERTLPQRPRATRPGSGVTR